MTKKEIYKKLAARENALEPAMTAQGNNLYQVNSVLSATVKALADSIEHRLLTLGSQSDEQLEHLLRDLGKLNSMAAKGHAYYDENISAINAVVYRLKSRAIEQLAHEWELRGMEVSEFGRVVYFRTPGGVQVSFHHPPHDFQRRVAKIKKTMWDGVYDAWMYTDINEYNEARRAYLAAKEKYESNEREDKQLLLRETSKIKEALRRSLRDKRTRRNLGLPEGKSEFLSLLNGRDLTEDDMYKSNNIPATIIQKLLRCSVLLSEKLAWRVVENMGEHTVSSLHENIVKKMHTRFHRDFEEVWKDINKKRYYK